MARGTTYTTFFNSVVDQTAAAKLEQLSNSAVASYGKISQAAAEASKAANLSTTGGGASTALKQQADAARALAQQQDVTTSSTQRFAAASKATNQIVATTAEQHKALAETLTSTSRALAVVQGPLGPLSGRINALSGALTTLSATAIGVSAAGAALFALASIGNEYANIVTKIRPFFDSQEAANQALANVIGIAQRSRSALEPIADLYVRLTNLSKELPTGTNIGQLSETIAKASTLSGGSAENQAEGIRQLTQGLGRGILNGQDLRALEEDSYNLAKTIADGLGVNVGKLKQLGAEGKLTTDVVTQALEREQTVVAYRFSLLPKTITSASQEFKNSLITVVGGFDQATGFTHALAEGLSSVAENLRAVIVLAGAVGASFAGTKALGSLGTAFDGLVKIGTSVVSSVDNVFNATKRAAMAALELANAEVEGAAASKAAAASRLAAAEQYRDVIQDTVVRLEGEDAVVKTSVATQVAAAEEAVVAARAAAVEQAAIRQAQAQADVDASLARVSALKAELAVATAARKAAAGDVVSAQVNGVSIADDPSLTRASRAKQATQAVRDQELAEINLTNALKIEEDATGALAAEQDVLTVARKNARAATMTEGEIQAIATAEQSLTQAQQAQAVVQDTLNTKITTRRSLMETLKDAIFGVQVAEEALIVTETAETAAIVEQTAAQRALAVASGILTVAVEGLATGIVGLLGLITSAPVLIGVAALAFLHFATSTNAAEDAVKNFAGGQDELRRQLGLTIDKIADADARLKKFALDQANQKISDSRDAAKSSLVAIAKSLTQTIGRLNPADTQAVNAIIAQLRAGNVGTAGYVDLAGQIADIKGRNPGAFQGNFVDRFIGRNPQTIDDQIVGLGGSLIDLGRANSALAALRTQVAQGPIKLGDVIDVKTLQTNAKAAADIGQKALAENNAFNKQIVDLNTKFGVKQGKIGEDGTPQADTIAGGASQAAAYQAQYQALYQQHEARLAQIQDESHAAHQAAQIQKQDQLGAIAQERDGALANLEIQKSKGQITQAQYEQEGIAVLARYDAEKTAIDETGSRSDSASAKRIADLRKEAAEAVKGQEQIQAIIDKYGSEPTPQARLAKDQRTVQSYVGKQVTGEEFLGQPQSVINTIKQDNPTGIGLFTQADADLVIQNLDPVKKALDAFYTEVQQNQSVSLLNAAGLTAEASALQKAFEIQRNEGVVSQERLSSLVAQSREVEHQNSLLADRQTITNNLLSLVDSTKNSFTQFLEGLGNQSVGKSIGGLFKSLSTNLKNTIAENLSTSLFSGATDAVKNLFRSKSPQDIAQDQLAKVTAATADTTSKINLSLTGVTDQSTKVVSSFGTLATAADTLTAHFNSAAGSGTGATAGTPAAVVQSLTGTNAIGDSNSLLGQLVAPPPDKLPITQSQIDSLTASVGASLANFQGDDPNAIVVTGKKAAPTDLAAGIGAAPTAAMVLGTIGKVVGGNLGTGLQGVAKSLGLDKTTGLGKTISDGLDKVSSGLGAGFGKAVQGFGTGAAVAGIDKTLGISKALGLKSSTTGAEIGGAIGSFIPIPGGQIIGSILGSIVGGLFKSTPHGQTTLSFDSNTDSIVTGTATGNNGKAKTAATQLGNSVTSALTSISDALDGTLTNNISVSVGRRGNKFTVDSSGQGKTKGSTVTKFTDEQDAINAAIADALSDGVISGISAASKKILASGQDLQTAITKAALIEGIPKQLLALTDPVKSAVSVLNDQFKSVIEALDEGGATAEQYTQAQTLYDMERATAIQQAAKSVFGTVEDYIKQLTDTTSSPLNKRTVYQNAQSTFAGLTAQIDAGKTVDQNDLVTAAKNFQDASQALNGSGSSFFDDFNYVLTELQKADKQATAGVDTSSTDLPVSPFTTDATAAAAIASAGKDGVAATNAGTAAVVSAVNALTAYLQSINKTLAGSPSGKALSLLGFNT